MIIKKWLPLQRLAQVRIARGILCNSEFKNVFPDFLRVHGLIDTQYKYRILSSLDLPSVLRNPTMGIIQALGIEIANWCLWHNVFLIDATLDYWNRIQWYSHGTINRLETARALIQDENINIGQRFNLACAYYLESDVRTLWKDMSLGYRYCFVTRKHEYKSRTFWLDALQTGDPLDWSQISGVINIENFFEHDTRNYFHRNDLGLLQLLPNLENPETRFRSILISIGNEAFHPFDLYLCLSKLEDHQLDKLFDCLSTEQRVSVCKSFLHWPLQGLFLEIFERLRTNMSIISYIQLFVFFLCEKCNTKWSDYDYEDLVKRIWSSLPHDTKSLIRRSEIFIFLKKVLDNEGQ
ncbi:uncharacterized protein NPIL_132441 [Nephila pilipes]|uniref:Uncharacterized protein n=1 Tax=Nephila pilipes TaxID=299642 RepID=A0A8X6PBP5_NEPPI|nr:uncharacterized protein NPIL_132441 [Nephila pilipes]